MEKRKYIIVRAEDQGRAIVILNKQDYEEEMARLLDTEDAYIKLPENPTQKLKNLPKKILQKGQRMGILTKKEAKYLVPKALRISTIYYLPKVKKKSDKTSRKTHCQWH